MCAFVLYKCIFSKGEGKKLYLIIKCGDKKTFQTEIKSSNQLRLNRKNLNEKLFNH